MQRPACAPAALPFRLPTPAAAAATVDHFSTFQLGNGDSASATFIPSLQGWQVNHLTGAAGYQLPIDVSAGPGGLQPDLTLSYTSGAVDGAYRLSHRQGSWVGLGWDLGMSSIALNKLSGADTDYYSLVLNGRSADLVRGGQLPGWNPSVNHLEGWYWHPTDETFWRIRYQGPKDSGMWVVWTRDGTRYEFADRARWGWGDCPNPTIEPYKWMLTCVRDPHGNEVTYRYQSYTTSSSCGSREPDSWPTEVTWGRNVNVGGPVDRFRVRFVSDFRRSNDTNQIAAHEDMEWDWASSQFGGQLGAPHQTRKLDALVVESMPGSVWQRVREYRFGYDFSLYSENYLCLSGPCSDSSGTYGADPAYRKLALRSVQVIGADGVSARPATTFSYHTDRGTLKRANGGWNRLATVANGQGGTLTYRYANIAQVLFQAGNPHFNLFFNRHRVTQEERGDGRSNTFLTTYDYTTTPPAMNNLGTANGGPGPNAHPNSATLVWGWRNNRLAELAVKDRKEFRGHAQVTETVYDGATTASPALRQVRREFVLGDVGCTPAAAHSGDACFISLRNREMVKGRAWRTTTLSGGGAALREVIEHYFVAAPSHAGDVDMTAQPQRGLWRAFRGTGMQETFQIDGANRMRRATVFSYDHTVNTNSDGQRYGNLGRVETYDETGARVRLTQHYYTINLAEGGAYLTDRKWADYTWNNAWQSLAYTAYFYDGGSTQGAIGSRGLLTRTSAFYNLPLSVVAGTNANSQDTTHTYDTFGNRLTTTTYAGPGAATNGSVWSFSAPGNGSAAHTTTTVYDPTFRVYPTQVTNPLGHVEQAGYDYRMGTLTSVTDVNNQTTSAQYDPFGRMTALVKPGDSNAHPTVTISYHDADLGANQPARVIRCEREVAGQGGCRPTTRFYDGLGRLIQTKIESQEGAQNSVTDTRYDALDRAAVASQARYVNETPATTFWSYLAPVGALHRPTTTSYDALDRPLLVTAPDGTTTDHRYAVWNFSGTMRALHDTIDARRHRVQRQYDSLGRLRAVDEITGNCAHFGYSCGGAFTIPWASGPTTRYGYDELDRLIQVVDPASNTTSLTYNSLGWKTGLNDPNLGAWQYGYHMSGSLAAQTDARGLTTYFSYDALERLAYQSPAYRLLDRFDNQNTSTFAWSTRQTVPFNDGGNNVVRSVGSGGDYSANFHRVPYTVAHGQGIAIRFKVDGPDTYTHLSLEASDGLSRFGVLAQAGRLDVQVSASGVWSYPATLLGTLTPHVWYWLTLTVDDQAGFRATIFQESNHANWQTFATPLPAGLSWRFRHWIYRGVAHLDDYHEYVGSPVHQYYDEAAGIHGKGRRTGNCVMDYHWTCTIYQRWEYDTCGRATLAGQNTFGIVHHVMTSYDSADRVATQHYYEAPETLTYGYDAAWRPISACTNLGGCFVSGASYDALGQPLGATLGGGISRSASYSSPMARLASLSVTAGATTLLSRSYGYDAAGNLTSLTDSTPGSPFGAQTFSYDRRDRLTGWWGSGVAEAYSYDAVGNLTAKAGVGYAYPAAGQPRPYAPASVGGQGYSYDANGNLLSGGGRSYVWNQLNKPASLTHAGVTEYYRYDGDGNRVVRVRNGQATHYAFGAWEHMPGLWARKHYPFNGQVVAQREGSGAPTYLHQDHLGSVAVTSDPWGGAVQRQFFDPWGRVRSGGTPGVTPNFTGQRLDDTGLLFYNARYYDPALGRFISPDPLVPNVESDDLADVTHTTLTASFFDPRIREALHAEYQQPPWFQQDEAERAGAKTPWGPANPQALNRYAYVENNPLTYTDASGHLRGRGGQCHCGGGVRGGWPGGRLEGPNRGGGGGGGRGGSGGGGSAAPIGLPSNPPAGQPPMNVLPSSGATFVGTPNGTLVRVPPRYQHNVANNQQGSVYRSPGSPTTSNANAVRIADPNAKNPNGYVRYYNTNGQPVNPQTGNPGPDPLTHIDTRYIGTLKGYPQ